MTLNRARAITVMALTIGLAGPTIAHVALEKAEAAIGVPYKAVLKVPHGCKGAPTVKIEVGLPEGFIGAKPMPKPGWKLSTTKGPYKASHAYYHGSKLTEGVTAVAWSGGELPDAYYDEFVVNGFIAHELKAGETLYFPVVQSCAEDVLRWVETPAPGANPHDLAAPAPMLRLIAAEAQATEAGAGTAKIGSVIVEGAFARATPPGATVGAGYLTLRNTGSAPDRLLSATLVGIERVEIHEMVSKDNVMMMRELVGGVEIPAGGTAELKPGGTHLMLMGLKKPFVAGEKLTAKLKFEKAGEVEIELPVRPIGAEKSEHSHH